MFNNKKGIELSVNFIVMLILAVAVFAGGLMFAAKFFSKAESMRANLDAETERQIEKLLDSGSPVVVPISTKEIFRTKYDTFGLGVLAKYNGEYSISCGESSAFSNSKDRAKLEDTGFGDWLTLPQEKLTLNKNQKGKVMILVQVPKGALSGTYMYRCAVTVTSVDAGLAGKEYDNPVQIIVRVP
jgi:hypothetical protein